MLKFASRTFVCAAMLALLVVGTGGTVQAVGQNAAGPGNKPQAKKTSKKRKKTRVVAPITIVLSQENIVRATPPAPAAPAPAAPLVGDVAVPTAPAVTRGSVSASRSGN